MKKKNFIARFFCAIGHGIRNFFCALIFGIIVIFAKLFFRCKLKGKEKVNKNDEARVFIANHYELYGPVAMYLRFPFKFRPWIIDKMMIPECIEKQMGLMIYNNYKGVPKFIKTIVVKCIKNLMVFVMKYPAKGISVSRENLRENIKTMKISAETLDKNVALAIFPELDYQKEGLGSFQTGFENIAKYYYQKTGKKITFYPVFISQVNSEMYIEDGITFDPENEPNAEKERIVTYLKSSMFNSYKTNETTSKKYLKHKNKLKKKEEKLKKKAERKNQNSTDNQNNNERKNENTSTSQNELAKNSAEIKK
jgi:hypothetical protein